MEGQNLFRRALSAAPALESDAPNPSGPPALKPRRTSLGRPQSKWKRSTVPVSDDELESTECCRKWREGVVLPGVAPPGVGRPLARGRASLLGELWESMSV